LKEALIINESLRFEPDAIIYGITLDDLVHLAPLQYPPIVEFFDGNSLAVERLAEAPPPTLADPFRRYQRAQAGSIRRWALWRNFRQVGKFIRSAANDTARSIARFWFPNLPNERQQIMPRALRYDCEKISRAFNEKYRNWRDWSVLDYLAELRDTNGIDVLVVSWPVAHEPRGSCYNSRYPADVFAEYTLWLEQKTADLDLPYLDLHDLLESRDFVDSLHPTFHGQRKVAARLEPAIIEHLVPSAAR
jgi:hypothetical protein